jgi:hypothetical protein
LRINYRAFHQIRIQADLLPGPDLSDVDGNNEERKGTISVFNGPQPEITVLDTEEDEISEVSQWLSELTNKGIEPHGTGFFVPKMRSTELLLLLGTQACLQSAW